ncbi:TetR family transcriptional regulator [Gordonia sp. i37]|nr:TetR family transcriptional regulator [Gordonia sp. i37]
MDAVTEPASVPTLRATTPSAPFSPAAPCPSSPTRWGDRDQRRADILTAGRRLLDGGGYSALRMREVAKGAGISLGAVYRYYPNKESLFVALHTRHLAAMMDDLDEQLRQSTGFVEAFTHFAAAYRTGFLAFGRDFDAQNVINDDARVPAELVDDLRAAIARILRALHDTLTRFGYTGDPDRAMTLLWASVSGLANHYATARAEFVTVDWDAAVSFAISTLACGLGLDPARS